ncbi:unnamed protein product [Candidatus Paraburkholderia kirkii UZHbot1]|uniref:WGS project CAFE00000000 data, contig bkir_c50 n=1 Tax=Candidatus Paraburkholderia kirkii UZHbot1 TaxID=1055526 RepID=U3UB10_9BURK|nr:unnamed protein product [Candidatus Paraburkholderia kirkii UZHbot1]
MIYGFLAFLLLRRVGLLAGVFIATATSAIITAVALGGLYFGRFTTSDALGSAALAAAWVFLIALTALWRNSSKPTPRPWMPVAVLAVICASGAVQLSDDTEAHSVVPATVVITPVQWTDSVWRAVFLLSIEHGGRPARADHRAVGGDAGADPRAPARARLDRCVACDAEARDVGGICRMRPHWRCPRCRA